MKAVIFLLVVVVLSAEGHEVNKAEENTIDVVITLDNPIARRFSLYKRGISRSSQCTFPGFTPGGAVPGMEEISIEPVTFEKNMLAKSLDYVEGKTGADMDKVIEVAAFFEEAPVVGGIVAIITKSLDIALDEADPDEILQKAQQSVLLLQDEVNKRLDQMRDYVDARDMQAEKRAMTNTYKELFDKWINCAKKPTKDDAKRCQSNVEDDIESARFHFQQRVSMFGNSKYDPNFYYRYVATWQWLEKYCGNLLQCPTHYDVKLIESGLVIFRDYASLHLLSLLSLIGTNKADKGKNADACKRYKSYMKKMENKADSYIKYVKWGTEWSKIRQWEENMYFGVPRRAGGGPASAERGGFLGTIKCASGKCTVECTQMIKDNKCTLSGGGTYAMMKDASQVCDNYLSALKKKVNDYWEKNVLEVVQEWEKYRDSAKNPQC